MGDRDTAAGWGVGEVGRPDAAERWLTKLEDKGLDADVVSYTSVVAAWAKVGNLDAAERWLAKLEDRPWRRMY